MQSFGDAGGATALTAVEEELISHAPAQKALLPGNAGTVWVEGVLIRRAPQSEGLKEAPYELLEMVEKSSTAAMDMLPIRNFIRKVLALFIG
jgi:hypothetical protein